MILVIGDAMIDHYIDGAVSRMAQEAPVPVFVPDSNVRAYPGGAANVAANIEALGEKAVLVSWGKSIKTRYVVNGNIVFRIDNDTKSLARYEDIIEHAAAHAPHASAIVISDYGKGVVSEPVAAWAGAAARTHGVPLIVDPRPPNCMECWRGATVVKMNFDEARIATSHHLYRHSVSDIAAILMNELGCANLIVTLGASGMILADKRGEVQIPSAARDIFDVVGAGDSVAAGLAIGLVRGWTVERAARFANAAAGVVVGKRGTATATIAEVEAALNAT